MIINWRNTVLQKSQQRKHFSNKCSRFFQWKSILKIINRKQFYERFHFHRFNWKLMLFMKDIFLWLLIFSFFGLIFWGLRLVTCIYGDGFRWGRGPMYFPGGSPRGRKNQNLLGVHYGRSSQFTVWLQTIEHPLYQFMKSQRTCHCKTRYKKSFNFFLEFSFLFQLSIITFSFSSVFMETFYYFFFCYQY